MGIGERLKELRKDRGLTQGELSDAIGISVHSINSYESGRRQPNSKAMTALEKYFRVSGEYLRGEIDRGTFMQKSDIVNDGLDEIARLLLILKEGMACGSQDEKVLAVNILQNVMETITAHLFQGNPVTDLSAAQVGFIFSASFQLNQQGRAELHKRAEELLQLPRYTGNTSGQA